MCEESGSNETYIKFLVQSLEKKLEILGTLERLTKEQQTLFMQSSLDEKESDKLYIEKNQQIEILNDMDRGFEQVYSRVANEIKSNQYHYKSDIAKLQALILQITDLTVSLQALEKRNSETMKQYFSNKRNEIKVGRKNNQMVTNYYKNMSGHQDEQSYFYDQKK